MKYWYSIPFHPQSECSCGLESEFLPHDMMTTWSSRMTFHTLDVTAHHWRCLREALGENRLFNIQYPCYRENHMMGSHELWIWWYNLAAFRGDLSGDDITSHYSFYVIIQKNYKLTFWGKMVYVFFWFWSRILFTFAVVSILKICVFHCAQFNVSMNSDPSISGICFYFERNCGSLNAWKLLQ